MRRRRPFATDLAFVREMVYKGDGENGTAALEVVRVALSPGSFFSERACPRREPVEGEFYGGTLPNSRSEPPILAFPGGRPILRMGEIASTLDRPGKMTRLGRIVVEGKNWLVAIAISKCFH